MIMYIHVHVDTHMHKIQIEIVQLLEIVKYSNVDTHMHKIHILRSISNWNSIGKEVA